MKLRTKFILANLMMALPVALVAVTGYRAVVSVGQDFDAAINRTQPVLSSLQDIRHDALRLATQPGIEADAEPGEDADASPRRRLIASTSRYQALVNTHFPAEIPQAQEIAAKVQALLIRAESTTPDAAEATAARMALAQDIETMTREAEEDELRELAGYQQGIRDETRDHARALVAMGWATFGLCLLLAWAMAYRLTRPLLRLHHALDKVGEGELGGHVPVEGEDEVAGLARTFNDMSGSLSRSLVSREYVENIVNSMAEAMVVVAHDGSIERTNQALLDLLGLPREALVGQPLSHLLPQAERILAASDRGEKLAWLEVELHGAHGTRLTAAVSAAPLSERGEHVGTVLLAQDITARKQAEERLAYLANYDTVTGLPNRNLLNDHLKLALSRLPWSGRSVAVLFCDLDGFKFINDNLGHETGDQMLAEVGRRIAEAVRPGDTVARFAGDELVVVLDNVADLADIDRVAQRVVERVAAPMDLGEHRHFITLSVGIAVAQGAQAVSAAEMLSRADLAMYAAKSEGRNGWRHYAAAMSERSAQRIQLEAALRQALADGQQLRVHYQPQCRADGSLLGFEALVRWEHPELGLVEPGRFLPVAEACGLMVPIDEWVLQQACRDALAWQQVAGETTRVSVNVSDAMFRHGHLVERVEQALRETGLAPSALELELTEAIVMSDADTAMAMLQALRGLGVRLAIDDFGTGYSSLAQLMRCPIGTLKIDRSFVRHLTEDRSSSAIVETVLSLAHKLGIEVVAEGVETPEQLQALRDLHCDAMQGYLIARPMPLDAAHAFRLRHVATDMLTNACR